jgi:hypothetical protein
MQKTTSLFVCSPPRYLLAQSLAQERYHATRGFRETVIRNVSLGLILGTSALAGPVFYAQTSLLLLKRVDEHLEKILAHDAGQVRAEN